MDQLTILKWYRLMFLMRRFEEEAARAYTERKIGGFLHLYIGQEAVATGVIEAADDNDYVISAYRDHGHYLARGGSPKEGMAELFGKETGCSKGRGGSMHFFDTANNFLGGHGIVGAHVPLAAGTAFASKYRKDNRVTICFLGDGAVNIGPFHEGMCLASTWKLPVVYVIENNLYSMGTPIWRSMGTTEASIRALGYPMRRKTVEGFDVFDCFDNAKEAIDHARETCEPTLLEYKTYRYRGHSMADPAKYRTKQEVKDWQNEKDPIMVLEQHIEKDYPELKEKLEGLRSSVEDEVADAVKFADESPAPDPATVGDYTYV